MPLTSEIQKQFTAVSFSADRTENVKILGISGALI